MVNSVDPDQTLHSAASDLVYTVCSGLSVPIFRVIMVALTHNGQYHTQRCMFVMGPLFTHRSR